MFSATFELLRTAMNIIQLLKKDLLLEWRQASSIASMLIYVISTVFAIYFSFSGSVEVRVWISIYWIVLLFVVVNLTVNAFHELAGRQFYYIRSMASPFELIVARLIYHAIYFTVLAALTLGVLALFLGFDMELKASFMLVCLFGSLGLSGIFTLLSAIAARTGNVALIAILGFPIVIPLMLLAVKLSVRCTDRIMMQGFAKEMWALVILNALIVGMAAVLFPYLWRD